MKTNSTIDLTYCTNIHSGESWNDHFAELQKNIPSIKSSFSPEKPMAIGLRLSNESVIQLRKDEKEIEKFQLWLNTNNLYIPTLNGFPFGDFHNKVIKDKVHSPDWLTQERVQYTINLAQLLSNWLPKGMEGSISTSPGSYRYWHTNLNDVKEKIAGNYWQVILELEKIYDTQGVIIHLDPEPEPDGVMESGEEFIDFYIHYLIKKATTERGLKGVEVLKRHLRLCMDVCHFAVEFEDIDSTFKSFEHYQIPIGKIQISSALKVKLSSKPHERSLVIDQLKNYEEPIYLHQVVQKNTDGSLKRFRDLSEALLHWKDPNANEWRIHYHVPVFTEHYDSLSSTRAYIEDTITSCSAYNYNGLFEIETYTWGVLPEDNKPTLQECIVKELQWVESKIHNLKSK